MKYTYFILIVALLTVSCNYKKTQIAIPEYTADDYYNQGLTNYDNGNYSESLENYNKAISIDSTISAYYLNRGAAKGICHDSIGELEDYRKAIQLDAHNAIAYYNMGCIYSDNGNDRDAIEFYRICMAIDPEYYPVYHNIAMSQYRLKDYESALKYFGISAQYNVNAIPFDFYYMGMIYKEKGDKDKAQSYLEKAAALGNEDAKKELK